MKHHGLIVCTLLLLNFALPHRASANLVGSEDFSGGTVDSTKWGSDLVSGGGTLTQTGGTLQYTTSGTVTSNDQAIHPWILNQGSYTQNWSVQLDVNLPTQTLTSGQELSIGLAAANASNTNYSTLMALQQDVLNGTLFYADMDLNGVAGTPTEQGGFSGGLASLELSYNATAHTITESYDANGPVGGYNWTTFATQDVSGWGMGSSDQFLVAITGASTNISVTSSAGIYADNFLAPGAVPEPSSWILIGLGFLGLIGIRRYSFISLK